MNVKKPNPILDVAVKHSFDSYHLFRVIVSTENLRQVCCNRFLVVRTLKTVVYRGKTPRTQGFSKRFSVSQFFTAPY